MAKFSVILAALAVCGGTAICQTSKPGSAPTSSPATGPASAPAANAPVVQPDRIPGKWKIEPFIACGSALTSSGRGPKYLSTKR